MVVRTQINRIVRKLPTIPWVWFLLCVVLMLGVLLGSCSVINTNPFVMMGGDEQLLVLLRGEKDGLYQVQYDGRDPAEESCWPPS